MEGRSIDIAALFPTPDPPYNRKGVLGLRDGRTLEWFKPRWKATIYAMQQPPLLRATAYISCCIKIDGEEPSIVEMLELPESIMKMLNNEYFK